MARVATRLSDAASTVNVGPAILGPRAMFDLKECLKQAGWVHWASGDGLALFSTTSGNVNDQITTAAAGAGGFGNNNAWWIGTDPSGSYQISIQRGTVDRSWRMYATRYLTTFTGGTPSSTVLPTKPTDAIQVIGLTDGFDTAFFPATATWKIHTVAENAPTNGVYGFWMWFYEPGVFSVRGFIIYDPIQLNTYPIDVSAEEDPFVVRAMADGANRFNFSTVGTQTWWTYYRTPGPYRTREQISACGMYNTGGLVFPGGVPVNSYGSATEDSVAIWMAQRGISPNISKGLTGQIRWKGTTKNYPDTLDLAGASPYVFAGDLLIPWPTGVAPV